MDEEIFGATMPAQRMHSIDSQEFVHVSQFPKTFIKNSEKIIQA